MHESWDGARDPLAGLARGENLLFERFVEVESGTFAGFFRRMGADFQEAEDLTQELFLKLYRQAPHYAPSERFAPFAFRIARNAWIDRTRRRSTRGQLDQVSGESTAGSDTPSLFEQTAGENPDAAEASAAREESTRLYSALAELSELHRAVFELGALQELSYSEVGDLLNIPVGTVKSRMYYALRRLRELLEPAPDDSTIVSETKSEAP